MRTIVHDIQYTTTKCLQLQYEKVPQNVPGKTAIGGHFGSTGKHKKQYNPCLTG